MIRFYSARANKPKYGLRKLHGRTLYKIWEYMHVETSHAYEGMNRGKWRHLPNKCRRWERALETFERRHLPWKRDRMGFIGKFTGWKWKEQDWWEVIDD